MSEEPRKYYYLLVRTDLPLATQFVQVAHAAITAGARYALPKYHHLVFLAVENQEALQLAHRMLAERQVQAVMFHEPDGNVGYTAICTEPVTGRQRAFFRQFPLWTFDVQAA